MSISDRILRVSIQSTVTADLGQWRTVAGDHNCTAGLSLRYRPAEALAKRGEDHRGSHTIAGLECGIGHGADVMDIRSGTTGPYLGGQIGWPGLSCQDQLPSSFGLHRTQSPENTNHADSVFVPLIAANMKDERAIEGNARLGQNCLAFTVWFWGERLVESIVHYARSDEPQPLEISLRWS